MAASITIDPILFDVFSAYFHADLVDLSDNEQVQQNATIVAAVVKQRVSDVDTLRKSLSHVLEDWDSDTVLRFVDASDIDWFADDRTERLLKEIVAQIIQDL